MLKYSKNTFKKHNSNSLPIKYLTTTVDILNTCHGVCGDDSYHKTMVNSSKFEPNPADFDENETLFEETNIFILLNFLHKITEATQICWPKQQDI